jgi:hypothetical protein
LTKEVAGSVGSYAVGFGLVFGIGSLIGEIYWLSGIVALALAATTEWNSFREAKRFYLWRLEESEWNKKGQSAEVDPPRLRLKEVIAPAIFLLIFLLLIGRFGPDGSLLSRIVVCAIGGGALGFVYEIRRVGKACFWLPFMRLSNYWPPGGHRTLRNLERRGVLRRRSSDGYEFAHQMYKLTLGISIEEIEARERLSR